MPLTKITTNGHGNHFEDEQVRQNLTVVDIEAEGQLMEDDLQRDMSLIHGENGQLNHDNDDEKNHRKNKRKESSRFSCSCLSPSSALIVLIFISCVILLSTSSSSIFGEKGFLLDLKSCCLS